MKTRSAEDQALLDSFRDAAQMVAAHHNTYGPEAGVDVFVAYEWARTMVLTLAEAFAWVGAETLELCRVYHAGYAHGLACAWGL